MAVGDQTVNMALEPVQYPVSALVLCHPFVIRADQLVAAIAIDFVLDHDVLAVPIGIDSGFEMEVRPYFSGFLFNLFCYAHTFPLCSSFYFVLALATSQK